MGDRATIIIKNKYPNTLSRQHVSNIIDYCTETEWYEMASWGEELSTLFVNGTATALEACNYFIAALNETVDDVARYSLDRNYNLVKKNNALDLTSV